MGIRRSHHCSTQRMALHHGECLPQALVGPLGLNYNRNTTHRRNQPVPKGSVSCEIEISMPSCEHSHRKDIRKTTYPFSVFLDLALHNLSTVVDCQNHVVNTSLLQRFNLKQHQEHTDNLMTIILLTKGIRSKEHSYWHKIIPDA